MYKIYYNTEYLTAVNWNVNVEKLNAANSYVIISLGRKRIRYSSSCTYYYYTIMLYKHNIL